MDATKPAVSAWRRLKDVPRDVRARLQWSVVAVAGKMSQRMWCENYIIQGGSISLSFCLADCTTTEDEVLGLRAYDYVDEVHIGGAWAWHVVPAFGGNLLFHAEGGAQDCCHFCGDSARPCVCGERK